MARSPRASSPRGSRITGQHLRLVFTPDASARSRQPRISQRSITALAESATNPRKRFDEKSLEELAASCKTQGILAPVLVRELEESKYQVVAGAHRLRAAKLAELEKLPVRVVKLTDAEAIEAQCVELSVVGKYFLC